MSSCSSLQGHPHAGRLGCQNWLCWLGPCSPDSGPGSTLSNQWPACYKGGHVFKVKAICRSYLQDQGHLEVKSSRSRLFVDYMFKVNVVWRSCLQGQITLSSSFKGPG